MSDNDTTLNVKGLDKIIKALGVGGGGVKLPQVRVGILGSKDARTGKAPSNATIGAAHEFGTTTLPQRSFLRVPIGEHLAAKMEAAGALEEDVMKEVIASGTVKPWMQKVAILAEGIVAEAFATGGFGKWQPLSPKTAKKKKNDQILVETNQLRESITSDVK